MEPRAYSTEHMRELQLEHWATLPKFWPKGYWRPPQPWLWIRAKVLYSLFPGDATRFKHLTDPVALTVLLLKLCPVFGVSVLVFIILFAMIERSDEFQLVNYVLMFKSYQFLVSAQSPVD